LVRDTLYEAFHINWGDGTSDVTAANSLITHDYGIISSFDVSVKGLINGSQSANDSSNFNCYTTTKQLNMSIDILPATINQVQVLSTDISSGNVSVEYSLAPNNNYLVEIRDQSQASFTVIDTINQVLNPSSYTIQNLNTANNTYCISITSFDPCDGDQRQSNIGCTINLRSTAQDQQNLIEWQTTSNDFLTYSIYKDGVFLTNVNMQSQMQFIDGQVICGTTYDYLLTMSEVNGFISISDTTSVIAISNDIPESIENISATVEGQNVRLDWEEPLSYAATGYILSRSEDGIEFKEIDTLTNTEYLDMDLFTQSQQYYYSIRYYDACDNLSEESIVASPVLLVDEFDKTLTWTDYTGWINGIDEYIIEKYDESGQLIESIPIGQSTSYQESSSNPYQLILYKVIAVPNDFSLENVESNIIRVVYRSKVAFPNAFSPDGDGMNDIFIFESRYITAVNMKIYNRWGELVYQTSEIDRGWDGTINGKTAPMGTYIHHTVLTDDMGITFVKSGEIILIR
jgi:gliding motility-associated-like protein